MISGAAVRSPGEPNAGPAGPPPIRPDRIARARPIRPDRAATRVGIGVTRSFSEEPLSRSSVVAAGVGVVSPFPRGLFSGNHSLPIDASPLTARGRPPGSVRPRSSRRRGDRPARPDRSGDDGPRPVRAVGPGLGHRPEPRPSPAHSESSITMKGCACHGAGGDSPGRSPPNPETDHPRRRTDGARGSRSPGVTADRLHPDARSGPPVKPRLRPLGAAITAAPDGGDEAIAPRVQESPRPRGRDGPIDVPDEASCGPLQRRDRRASGAPGK
jgi:hypothetical protein